jgi:dTDP-4-dehydrorhamnose reductase
MVDPASILMTGGSGRLGTELRQLLGGVVAPDEHDLDITDPAAVARHFDEHQPKVLLHLAAYTDVAGAETTGREACWRINVDGTRNLVREAIARDVAMVHISTDYVFDGTRGGYREDDTPGPVRNYYSLTKLVAEQLVRLADRHLVIRTSFRPREWAYPVAFADIYTSQDYVDIIAPQIALAVRHSDEIDYRTLHIATERKSVYELAARRKPDVEKGTKAVAKVNLPDDISLDISRWQDLKKKLENTAREHE